MECVTWIALALWEEHGFPRVPGVFAVGGLHQGSHWGDRPGWDSVSVSEIGASAELWAGNCRNDGGFQEPLKIQPRLTCERVEDFKEQKFLVETSNLLTDESESRSVVYDSLRLHELYSPWNSPGQNAWVGSLFLLQGIFPTRGLNPSIPHCQRSFYQLSNKGSPRILEWVADPFSSGSSWPRNWAGVSCTAGGFFANWAIREAPVIDSSPSF